MGLPETQNIEHWRGDTWTSTMTFLEDDEVTPADITGFTYKMQLRKKFSDADPAAEATVTVDLPNAKVTFEIPANVTDDLIGSYHYDIQYTDADGKVQTIISGTFFVHGEATR